MSLSSLTRATFAMISGALSTSRVSHTVGGFIRTLSERLGDINSIKDYGANGDGVSDDTQAFVAADSSGRPCLVPSGTYKVTAPIPTGLYYGDGVISVSGVLFSLDKSVPTRINTGTSIDPNDPDTITQGGRYFNLLIGQGIAPNGTTPDARASTVIGSGSLQSTDTPIRLTGVGKQVFNKVIDGYAADAVGSDALGLGERFERCTALGSNALKWVGSINPVAALHDYYRDTGTTANDFITDIGLDAPNRWPAIRATIGSKASPATAFIPTARVDASQSVAVGRNALLHSLKSDSNVAVGVNSLAHLLAGSYNTAVGTRALRDCVTGGSNVAIGNNAAATNITGFGNVAIGFSSLSTGSHTSYNVAIGYESAKLLTGTDVVPSAAPSARRNTYIGTQSGASATNGSFNTALGARSLYSNSGSNNTAIGTSALTSNTTGGFNTAVGFEASNGNISGTNCVAIGSRSLLVSEASNNTAVGVDALRLTQSGGSHVSYTNCTGIGYGASVAGDNQVQLGNSATTTYVFGTVQNRSDARDKADVVDTALGLDFIMGLRPVDGRWDMRDDYVEEYQVQVGTDEDAVPLFETRYKQSPRDGSKKRERLHHWFIAQEVKSLCDGLGVEFGGYQDHTVNGGSDVLTLGYDEFIPPIVRAIQQVREEQLAINSRLSVLEDKLK